MNSSVVLPDHGNGSAHPVWCVCVWCVSVTLMYCGLMPKHCLWKVSVDDQGCGVGVPRVWILARGRSLSPNFFKSRSYSPAKKEDCFWIFMY